MNKSRLEAFSDGVFAIIITIMVLEMKIPHGDSLADLAPILPTFLSYVMSYIYVGIYWNNHHHVLHAATRVTGAILWANLHLLFWLSLFPFATGWIGQYSAAPTPTAAYGVVLMMAGVAYTVLEHAIIRAQGKDSILKQAVGNDLKGKASVVIILAAILVALRFPRIAEGLYVLIAMLWFIPDRRIEKRLAK